MKILILGCSDIAIRRIIPAIKKISNLKFDISSKSKTKENYGQDKWFQDYETALKNTNARIVYVSLVNAHHFIYAKKALNMNKHVIVDKPITISLKKTLFLIKLARKKKLLLTEALVFHYHRQFEIIKKIIKKNKNKINKIIMKFCIPKPKKNNFKLSKKFGGGCLNDMSPYAISVIRNFLKGKLVYKNVIKNKKNNINESFSINAATKKIEFYGIFSHNSEYTNSITFHSNSYIMELNRFSAPPNNIDLQISLRKKNVTKNIIVKKDDTFKKYLSKIINKIKNKNFNYYLNQIECDARLKKIFLNT